MQDYELEELAKSFDNPQPPKERIRVKKRKYGAFAIVVITFFLMIIALSFYLLFFVRVYDVKGYKYTEPEEIVTHIEMLPLSSNSVIVFMQYNLFPQDLPPQIKSIDLSLKTPWTVGIVVEEKEPVGGILVDEEYVYCDEEGLVIHIEKQQLENVPIIEGVKVEKAVLFQDLPTENVNIFKNILEVTSVLETEELVPNKISGDAGSGVVLEFGDIIVQLGEGNYNEKIAQIEPMLEKLVGQKGILHLENFSITNTMTSFEPIS